MMNTKIMTRVGVIGLFFCSLALAADKPNVVLVLTDNQSYFELGCHGHKILKTPRIDALAEQSVDFLNFHAPPFCSPSRAALLTGRYSLRYGIHTTIQGRSILKRDEVTLANLLGETGYRTAIFGKWHLGFSYPYMPRFRGFDETFVHGGGGIGQLEDYFGNTHIDASYWRNGNVEKSNGFSTDVLFDESLKFIEKYKERPFFCFISTPATHSPWQAHPDAAKRLKELGVSGDDLALYSMIENIDTNVGRLIDKLDELGLTEKTILILATDQGMNDRGAPEPTGRTDRETDKFAYDEKNHVFCMVRYPPLTKPHQSMALTGMVDIAPTILDLTGVRVPDNMDGRSLRPLLAGASGWDDDRTLIVQCPRAPHREKWRNAAVKTQRWRLVGGDKLYDVSADFAETNNVAAKYPEVVKSLTAGYDDFWSSLPPEQETLSRHVIGEHPTRLCAMDWVTGKIVWNGRAYSKRWFNGEWAVEVEQPGRYRIEMRVYPRESGREFKADTAKVRVGDIEGEASITPEGGAVAELDLEPGEYEMSTALTGGRYKGTWGALFVYISPVGESFKRMKLER
jgi:arylsulfatase A-like enzyme